MTIRADDHVGLAVKVARDFHRGRSWRNIESEDAVQIAIVALCECIPRFDPERGVKFSTFAGESIKCTLRDAWQTDRRLVSFGHGKAQSRANRYLRRQNHREIDRTKIAALLDRSAERFSEEEAHRAVGYAQGCEVPMYRAHTTGTNDPEDMFPAEDAHEAMERAAECGIYQKRVGAILDASRETFNDHERVILDDRLLADEPATLNALGERLGVSRQRIQQLEARMLDRLRERMVRAELITGGAS